MRIDTVMLKNYRCYSELTLELDEKLTVLVAENGFGKTSLLDAIRVALWPFIASFDLAQAQANDAANSISIDDARLVQLSANNMARQLPAEIAAKGDYGTGKLEHWARFRESEDRATKTKDKGGTKAMKAWVKDLQSHIRTEVGKDQDLPVFGYYGTGRLWANKRLQNGSKKQEDKQEKVNRSIRTHAYKNCLDPASSYKHFEEWFTEEFKAQRELQIKSIELGLNSELQQAIEQAKSRIQVIQGAVDCFLKETTGWHTLEHSITQGDTLILHHDTQGMLKTELLSDGIRSMLALAGDIAYRCLQLNPHLGANAALKTRGVVLIDEVDMHLHPSWQQKVLLQFEQAFPCIQFIVTTHSPQVLTTVAAHCIRVLTERYAEGNQGSEKAVPHIAVRYVDFSEGAQAQQVLEEILGVTSRPETVEIVQKLNRYIEFIQRNAWDDEEALKLRDELNAWGGGKETELMRLDMDIRMREYRQKQGGNRSS
ncbi:MAG: AAA family ATPase [Yersiniaceae bacterium]|nr:AAA family ATPase [Yersiniaceae bacterium]